MELNNANDWNETKYTNKVKWDGSTLNCQVYKHRFPLVYIIVDTRTSLKNWKKNCKHLYQSSSVNCEWINSKMVSVKSAVHQMKGHLKKMLCTTICLEKLKQQSTSCSLVTNSAWTAYVIAISKIIEVGTTVSSVHSCFSVWLSASRQGVGASLYNY